MKKWRGIVSAGRMFWFVVFTSGISTSALMLRALGKPHANAFKHYSLWKTLIQRMLNVELEIYGSIPDKPGILMSNHRSYFDVVLVAPAHPAVFVAKADVKSWPLFGYAAGALKTIWVDRESKTSRKETRKAMNDRLRQNLSVILFPEGTTHYGPEILPYKPGMFQTAANQGFTIYAAALEYEEPDVAWVNDELFFPHVYKLFKKKKIRAKLAFSRPFTHTDADTLKHEVETWTEQQLLKFRQEWDSKHG